MENRYPYKGKISGPKADESRNFQNLYKILLRKKKIKEIEKILPLLLKENKLRKKNFYSQMKNEGLFKYANLITSEDPTIKVYKHFATNPLDKILEELENDLINMLSKSRDLENDLQFLGIEGESGKALFSNKLTKDGFPLVFFHGVRKFNPMFRSSAMGDGVEIPFGKFNPSGFPATYFAKNMQYAMFYAGIAPNMPIPDDNYSGFVYPVTLKMFNPLDLRELGFTNTFNNLKNFIYLKTGVMLEKPMAGLDEFQENPVWGYVRIMNDGIEKLKKIGIDGIIQIGDIPKFDTNGQPLKDRNEWIQEDEYLTFYPSQVKSIITTKTFINTNPNPLSSDLEDIRIYKKGGYVSIK